jgi:PTS system nitrogen regulatory IIA component
MNLNVHDAARLLSVSEKTIYRWVRQGRLPAYRLQDQYRFNRAELLEWATSNRIDVSPELFLEPESGDLPLPLLAESLAEGGIYYRIEGETRDEVIRAAVQNLRLPEGSDRDLLFQLFRAREELCSTGIGEGIAIPHVRNPLVLHAGKTSISLFFLESPVNFKAPDGQAVRILFTILSPTTRGHLHMLSRLTYALRDSRLQETLKRVGSREEIMKEFRRMDEYSKLFT